MADTPLAPRTMTHRKTGFELPDTMWEHVGNLLQVGKLQTCRHHAVRRLFVLILSAAVVPTGALTARVPGPERDHQARTAPAGDPLPPGAVGRLGTTPLRHAGWVHSVAFAPDGKTLVSGSWDRTIRRWELATGKELGRLLGHTHVVEGLAFTPDGKRVASAGHDQTIRLWDRATNRELHVLRGHTDVNRRRGHLDPVLGRGGVGPAAVRHALHP